jgi:alpha-tubulin suppressor-like RCC1 family protein
MSLEPVTNFKDSNGVDLGTKLVTKDYLISVYPGIGQQIGIPPELWAWGTGTYGVLGNNSGSSRSTPVTTSSGGTDWKQISAGSNHAAAIKTDGTLWIWGNNSSFKLGNNVTTAGFNALTPVTTFSGGTNWKQVSCGGAHTAAIKTDGTLWTWGYAGDGRLGNGNILDARFTPITTFAGGTNWKQVSSGLNATMAAIKTDGTLWTWGFSGYLGIGVVTGNRSTPVTTFSGGNNWKQVACGSGHMAAIKTDGTLWTWGYGGNGRLGNGVTSGTVSTPVTTFAGGTNWKQVACGSGHMAAIKTDGTLWTWGNPSNGRLGNAVITTNRSTPVTTFSGGTNWKQVECGYVHTAAIKTDGTLWTWGYGGNGRLGNGVTSGTVSTPVTTFAGGTNWKQVNAGNGGNNLAIKSVDFADF